MAAAAAAANLDRNHTRPKEPSMFTNLMTAELAATRRVDLIAAADTARLAGRARRARRARRLFATAPRVRRTWVRTATQPIHV
jgi:hypothetical protein